MPKINVYLPDRLAEAVRRFEVPVSAICQQALEREVAARLPLLELTPRAREVLLEASRQANRLGSNYIGVEHLQLAVLDEGKSLAAQVVETMGITEALRARLHEVIASPSPPSNRAVDGKGNLLGYLLGDPPRLVGLDGRWLRTVADGSGDHYAVDEEGNRTSSLPADSAPYLVSINDEGHIVVIIDENGRHTGQ